MEEDVESIPADAGSLLLLLLFEDDFLRRKRLLRKLAMVAVVCRRQYIYLHVQELVG